MAAAGAGDGLSDTANRVAIDPAVLAQGLVVSAPFARVRGNHGRRRRCPASAGASQEP